MQNSNEPEIKKSTLPSSRYPDCWPMVRITWMDAMDGDTGWVPLSKMMNAKLATCVDIGWMIRNDEQRVTIMGWKSITLQGRGLDHTRTRLGSL
jgi:hypothetical protein